MEPAIVMTTTPSNPVVGDMYLDSTGNAVMHTDLASEFAQRLRVRFSFFRGEWFMDLNEGTPWFQFILVKGPTDRNIRTVFTQVIMNTEGADELLKFGYAISKQRQLSVTFEVRMKDGSTFRSADFGQFVVAI